jgi:hypothetical protein
MPNKAVFLGLTLALAGWLSPASVAAQNLERLDMIGPHLGDCIRLRLRNEGKRHSGQREVTLTMAFRADGALIASPRVAFSMPAADQPGQQRFIFDITTTLANCTPLRFSSGLGGAIAGRPYRFRYRITNSQDLRV